MSTNSAGASTVDTTTADTGDLGQHQWQQRLGHGQAHADLQVGGQRQYEWLQHYLGLVDGG